MAGGGGRGGRGGGGRVGGGTPANKKGGWGGPTVIGKAARQLGWAGGKSALESGRLGKGFNAGTLSRSKSSDTKLITSGPHIMHNKGPHRSGGTSTGAKGYGYFKLVGNRNNSKGW